MLVFGLDFETTCTTTDNGLDPRLLKILEIGGVLWDTETKKPVQLFQTLVTPTGFLDSPFDPKITEVTGLTQNDFTQFDWPPTRVALDRLIHEMRKAEYIVAHNGTEFDKVVFETECKPYGLPTDFKWIDTMTDIPYPKLIQTRKLPYLAAEHGFINPFSHRAIFDVLTMLRVMSCYPFEKILERRNSPRIVLQSLTETPWIDVGKSNQIAKFHGFRWDGQKKAWLQTVLENEKVNYYGLEGLKVVPHEN